MACKTCNTKRKSGGESYTNKKVIKKRYFWECGVEVVPFLVPFSFVTDVNVFLFTFQMSKNETTDFVPIIEVCASDNQNTWLVIIYIYKGLLLLFGVFLAWETRKVKIPALNDSNYIAVCVYNVVIMSVLAVFINNFVTQGDQVTVSYVLLALCILFMTTATLCLLFVPKVRIPWQSLA